MALTGLADPLAISFPIAAVQGGTGQTAYAVGDTLYANTTTTLAKLADVAVGSVLISGGVATAPAWSNSPVVTGTVGAKPAANAGIQLDPNAATGNFTLSLSPANITAARRWSFPNRSDTVAGLLAQTFTATQTISKANSAFNLTTVTDGHLVLENSSSQTMLMFSFAGTVLGGVRADGSGNLNWHSSGTQGHQFYKTTDTSFQVAAIGGGGIRIGGAAGSVATQALEIVTATASTSTTTGAAVISGGVGIGGALNALTLNSIQGTITTAVPTLSSTVTWNAGGVTFTGWKLNVTDTASAAASPLIDLQVGGVSKFSVRKDSLVTMAGLAYAGASAGELWYDTTQKAMQAYPGAVKQALVGCLHSGLGTAGPSNTVTETSIVPISTVSLGTQTLPANFMASGKAVRITIAGVIGNTGTPTLRLRLFLGSIAIVDTTALTMSSVTASTPLEIVAVIFCSTTGATGLHWGYIRTVFTDSAGTSITNWTAINYNISVDTTTSNVVDIKATWGTANALNVISGNMSTIEVLN